MLNGFIAGWRVAFLAIAVNLLISIGVAFLPIDDVHITSMIATAAYTVFALCLMLFVGRKNLAAEITETGFRGFNPLLIPLIILFPVAAQFFCSFFTLPITAISSFLLGFETKEQALTPHTSSGLVLAFGYLCILAPVSEEIIFRGVIYRFFEKHSSLTAIFGSAAVFALAHLDLRSLVPIFFIGLTLSMVRFATGSIWATMISHAAVNLLTLMLMMVRNDSLYNAITIAFAASFPLTASLFLRTTPFPKLYRSGKKSKLSVCMILTIVLFIVLQLFSIASNIAEQLYSHYDWFDSYFNEKYGFDDDYDFYDDYNEYDRYYNFR